MAIWTAPSIFPSFAGAFELCATGAGADAMVLKSISWTLVSAVSSFLRYASMSFPLRNNVWLEELAWMAKVDDEEPIEESRTVTTLENTDSVIERGDTANISSS